MNTDRDIDMKTYYALRSLEDTRRNLDKAITDPQQKIRRENRECQVCYYMRSGTLSGQAFTPFECRECGGVFQHHTTRVPILCDACADKLNVCRRCQADMNLTRRASVDGEHPIPRPLADELHDLLAAVANAGGSYALPEGMRVHLAMKDEVTLDDLIRIGIRCIEHQLASEAVRQGTR